MCQFLQGDGVNYYICSFTKKRCGYQKFCSERLRYLVNPDKCPIYKAKTKTQQTKK